MGFIYQKLDTYYLRLNLNGKTKSFSLKTNSIKQAKLAANKIIKEYGEKGFDIPPIKTNELTLTVLLEKFIKWRYFDLSERTKKDYFRWWKEFVDYSDDVNVTQVTPQHINNYKIHLMKRVNP